MPDRRNDMGGLFRRDLDRVELPPRDTWRPTPLFRAAPVRSCALVSPRWTFRTRLIPVGRLDRDFFIVEHAARRVLLSSSPGRRH